MIISPTVCRPRQLTALRLFAIAILSLSAQLAGHHDTAYAQETQTTARPASIKTGKDSSEQVTKLLTHSADGSCRSSVNTQIPSQLAVNKLTVSSAARIYQVRPLQTDSSSALLSFSIVTESGALIGDPQWNKKPAPQPNRQIITVNSDKKPVATNDTTFSAPLFVGRSTFNYNDNIEPTGQKYSDYRRTQSAGMPMVYVGSSQGVLHGFRATDGVELFAFVSSSALTKANPATNTLATSPQSIGGTQQFGDVFYDNKWHTVLIGGLGNFGKGIYALDISSPQNLVQAQSHSADVVRWEYTDHDDADVGYIAGQPQIVRLHNGRWAAVFGNGYADLNAAAGSKAKHETALFFVDIETGSAIRKLSIPSASTGTPNGLSTPALVDVDGDRTVDYAYAGDLSGNLWKFDLRSNNPDSWSVAFGAESNPLPLFSAQDGTTRPQNQQPITQRPLAIRGPNGKGVMLLFGTGFDSDILNTQVSPATKRQTFYGIFDKSSHAESDRILNRGNLQQQTIEAELYNQPYSVGSDLYEYGLRAVSANHVDWNIKKGWYLDLPPPTTGRQAETLTSNPTIRGNRLIFTTTASGATPCEDIGNSWLMVLDAVTGGRLAESQFDLNHDNLFNSHDRLVTSREPPAPVSGLQFSRAGVMSGPVIVEGDHSEYLLTQSADGHIHSALTNPGGSGEGRQSWIQLR